MVAVEDRTDKRQLVTGGDPDVEVDVPGDKDFEDAGQEFIDAPELAEVGRALIESDFGLSARTRGRNIVYAWKRKGGKAQDADQLAFCLKVGPLPKHLSGADFVVWVAADHARGMGLTATQREALLFHELCHIGRDGKGKASVRHHDAELFLDELRRYGPWKAELDRARVAFEQVPLPIR